MRVKQESIGPDRAQQLLDSNSQDRRVDQQRLARYRDEMKREEWRPCAGEPIYVSKSGKRLNGRHRLLAVVESETTQEFIVIYDVPDDFQLIADTGKSRNFADHLAILGKKNAIALASATSQIMLYESYQRLGSLGGSLNEVTITQRNRRFQEIEVELLDAVSLGERLRSRFRILAPSVAIALVYLCRRDGTRAEADEFFEGLIREHDREPESPLSEDDEPTIRILCITLMEAYGRRKSGAARTNELTVAAAKVVKAYNFWRTKTSIASLRWPTTGKKGRDFPTIESFDDDIRGREAA